MKQNIYALIYPSIIGDSGCGSINVGFYTYEDDINYPILNIFPPEYKIYTNDFLISARISKDTTGKYRCYSYTLGYKKSFHIFNSSEVWRMNKTLQFVEGKMLKIQETSGDVLKTFPQFAMRVMEVLKCEKVFYKSYGVDKRPLKDMMDFKLVMNGVMNDICRQIELKERGTQGIFDVRIIGQG